MIFGTVVELVDTLDLVRQITQTQIQWAAMPVRVQLPPVLLKKIDYETIK